MKYSLFTVVLADLTPENIVKELANNGFDGVEWRIHKDYHFNPETIDREAGQIKQITEDAGLVISNLATYIQVADFDSAKKVIESAKVMNAPSLRLCVPEYNPKDGYNALMRKTRKNLEKLVPVLDHTGIKVLVETHHLTITSSASLGHALLKGLPPEYFGVIYDPGNLAVEGKEQWRMGLEILGRHLAYVHVKNVGWVRHDNMWKPEWMPLEDGIVDWEAVIAALKDAGYDGFLSIENLYGMPSKAKGLINEDLSVKSEVRPLKERTGKDIAYLRSIESAV